jgi:hypothetical protein
MKRVAPSLPPQRMVVHAKGREEEEEKGEGRIALPLPPYSPSQGTGNVEGQSMLLMR